MKSRRLILTSLLKIEAGIGPNCLLTNLPHHHPPRNPFPLHCGEYPAQSPHDKRRKQYISNSTTGRCGFMTDQDSQQTAGWFRGKADQQQMGHHRQMLTRHRPARYLRPSCAGCAGQIRSQRPEHELRTGDVGLISGLGDVWGHFVTAENFTWSGWALGG